MCRSCKPQKVVVNSIISSDIVSCPCAGDNFVIANAIYLFGSIFCISISSMLGLVAVTSTALTYLVLWVSQKAVEVV